MKFKKRRVVEGRITRIYEKGGILLSQPRETLAQMSEGLIEKGTPEENAVNKCLLCDKPAIHWGLFMAAEEAIAYKEQRQEESTGTFFGLCEMHSPHEKEDEVCDAVYTVMELALKMEEDLAIAEEAVNTWLEELTQQGFSKEDALGLVLFKLKEGGLVEGYDFSEQVKQGLEIALRNEVQKEQN